MEEATLPLDVSWMGWTWQTATFFVAIGVLLIVMTLITALRPRAPRVGVLGIETTPGDRLFLSLLGSAYICLAGLFFLRASDRVGAGCVYPVQCGGLSLGVSWVQRPGRRSRIKALLRFYWYRSVLGAPLGANKLNDDVD